MHIVLWRKFPFRLLNSLKHCSTFVLRFPFDNFNKIGSRIHFPGSEFLLSPTVILPCCVWKQEGGEGSGRIISQHRPSVLWIRQLFFFLRIFLAIFCEKKSVTINNVYSVYRFLFSLPKRNAAARVCFFYIYVASCRIFRKKEQRCYKNRLHWKANGFEFLKNKPSKVLLKMYPAPAKYFIFFFCSILPSQLVKLEHSGLQSAILSRQKSKRTWAIYEQYIVLVSMGNPAQKRWMKDPEPLLLLFFYLKFFPSSSLSLSPLLGGREKGP